MTHRVLYQYMYTICDRLVIQCPAVMLSPSSRPKWPRGQNFGLGLGLKDLASVWPRSRCLIM